MGSSGTQMDCGAERHVNACWDMYRRLQTPEAQARLLKLKGSRGELMMTAQAPFVLSARKAQMPPEGDWRTWLFMGGRGAGKTRAGAEWVRWAILFGRIGRVALIGPALSDVREVMIEGTSGLANLPGYGERPVYQSSRRRLVWPNGAEAYAFSAEDPDSLRGPQFDAAWCDEIGAWRYGPQTWDMLQMGLRLGHRPQCVATTTPRPVELVERLFGDPRAAITRAGTAENAAFLSPEFMQVMEAQYGGSVLGRQELLGELIEDAPGALFSRQMIDVSRISLLPQLDDVVVALDPPTTSGAAADACGIIGVGVTSGDWMARKAVVLGDASAAGLSPIEWAGRAVALAEQIGAGRIIAEANQGGEMVRQTLLSAGCRVPVQLVHARVSKQRRAMPVATLYAQGRVAHYGVLPGLEDEMCRFGGEGFRGSPDRVDALVWGVWAMLLEQSEGPRARIL